jgi:hypothetical protein
VSQIWTIEDLKLINPPEINQQSSFIETLLENAHVPGDLLLQSAAELELAEGEIFLFGQVPLLSLPNSLHIQVPGRTIGTVLTIDAYPSFIFVDETGRLVRAAISGSKASEDTGLNRAIPITQFRGRLKLDLKRAELHKKYMQCLGPTGLKDNVIGTIKPWMDLPIAQLQYPNRRAAPLTASLLQAEIAHRSRIEFNFALLTFLKGYSLATLTLLPSISEASAYFAMIAPGRVACATKPRSALFGMPSISDQISPSVSVEQVQAALKSPLALHDRVVQQLSAMTRLVVEGQSELALVGCITVMEWYINDHVRSLRRRPSDSGSEWSVSIERILKSGLLSGIPVETQAQLRQLVKARNEIVHGAPMSRSVIGASVDVGESRVTPEVARNALRLAVNTYQYLNLRAVDA